MTKKTRLIVLFISAILFFIVTPYAVLYSLGYRLDFDKRKIVGTGGIYVKASPPEVDIIIDTNKKNTTGILSYSVFEQNLMPGNHDVVIKKTGYHNYQKSLLVKEKEVTKLEHVILIKERVPFTLLKNTIDNFYITPDGKKLLTIKLESQKINAEIINLGDNRKNSFSIPFQGKIISDLKWSPDSNKALLNMEGLDFVEDPRHSLNNYFLMEPFLEKPQIVSLPYLLGAKETLFNPVNSSQIFYIKNKNLFVNAQLEPLLKNIITYQITDTAIIWLSYDGFFYQSDLAGNTTNKISSQILSLKKNGVYQITIVSGKILLKENDSLLILNQEKKIFENFYDSIKNIKVSPDGQKIIYFNANEILLSYVHSIDQEAPQETNKILLNRFSEQIKDCYWLGNEYVIFNLENKIIISEIDNRNNINAVELPNNLLVPNRQDVTAKNPDVYFNQKDKKLYILTEENLFSSEQLIP